jgi:hypothetical protein
MPTIPVRVVYIGIVQAKERQKIPVVIFATMLGDR